jgi:hypothetical protein
MAKHEIAKSWTSAVDGIEEKLKFDLTNLNEFGTNVKECKHGSDFIFDGSVEKVENDMLPGKRGYVVRFDEPPNTVGNFQLQYRGVAIYSPTDGQFHNIVGVRRKRRFAGKAPAKTAGTQEDVELLVQEEGTWTGTQP